MSSLCCPLGCASLGSLSQEGLGHLIYWCPGYKAWSPLPTTTVPKSCLRHEPSPVILTSLVLEGTWHPHTCPQWPCLVTVSTYEGGQRYGGDFATLGLER